MSAMLSRLPQLPTMRAALIASYRGALRLGAELQAASLAGRALEQHGDIEAALQSIRELRQEQRVGREDKPLSEGEWDLVGASVYLRMARAEEAVDRYRPGRSDEGEGVG